LSELRIMGVLQRIALSYLFTALMEIVCYSKIALPVGSLIQRVFYQITCSWKQWLIILLVILTWCLFTFLAKVPGCPTGYLGPGGLDEFGKYYNCTAGFSGYVDRVILGNGRLYAYPTFKFIFKTTEGFEPEGIMGTLNSIVLVFLGVQAGRITILYKTHLERCLNWFVWGLLSFLVYGLLTGFTLESGWIPVNKNLWTLTYTLLTASISFWIFILFYIIIDMKKWWNGNPFIYPGKNSIIIYICHSIFQTTFPIQWLVSTTHVSKIFMSLWGACFWILFAAFLNYKKIFFNV
jgi:heparan-alpha-glucosaminide N-acetyltransferase